MVYVSQESNAGLIKHNPKKLRARESALSLLSS